MSWPDNIAEGFPHRHDREPGRLRDDIVDELADHLSCALDRELRRNDNEATARRAVLERFGDPTRIARKLWFDAMKEIVMKDRVMMIAAVLVAAACIALTVLVMSALQQGRQVNEAILARLDALDSAGPAKVDLEWGAATLQLANPPGRDVPLSGIKVELIGNAINPSEGAVLDAVTNTEGLAGFRPIRPGTFTLRVYGEGGLWHERLIVVMPGGEQNEELVWPRRFPLVDVSFEIDWPKDLRDKNLLMHCNLTPMETTLDLEGAQWMTPRQVRFSLSSDGKVLGQVNSRPGEQVHFPHHPSPLADFPAGTSVAGTLRLTPQHYHLAAAAVYCPSYGPKHDAQYTLSQSLGVKWTDGRWPTYEASSGGSGNRWRIPLSDGTIHDLRQWPALGRAFLEDRLAATGYGDVVHRLPITDVYQVRGGTVTQRIDHDHVSVWNTGRMLQVLLRWPMIPAVERSRPDRRFVLALHARESEGATANPLVLHEIPHTADQDSSDVVAPDPPGHARREQWLPGLPPVLAEPAGRYAFEPGHGWRLFDVTKLVRPAVAGRRDSFGVLLGFASEAASKEDQVSLVFSGPRATSRQGPFPPVLLVVEAGGAAN